MLPKILSPILNFDDLGFGIYRYHINWTDTFLKQNISIIENNYKLFPNRNRWNCDCHVIHDDDNDVEMINFNFLRSNYEKIINTFCNLKGYAKPNINSDIWYNYYKIGQYQEPHIHGDLNIFTLTVVHYILYDEKYHEPTRFTDERIVLPKIKSGDMLIFPGSYEHYVLENQSEFPRLTVAFGVGFS